jgi:hypothetical protein
MQFTTEGQQTQHHWMSNDMELREAGKFGKMKAPQPDKDKIERQKLRGIWNNRADLSKTRYFHPTPKEHRPTHYKNTQQNFVWTEDQSRASPINITRITGKRHVSPPQKAPSSNQQQSNPIRLNSCPSATPTDRATTRSGTNIVRSSVAMNLSRNVQDLLHHQIHKPSSIRNYPSVTGKRNAGRSPAALQKKSEERDRHLNEAETARLSRVKEAKGTMYTSDASSYFGFQSKVPEPKPRIFSTPVRKSVESRAHAEHQCPLY